MTIINPLSNNNIKAFMFTSMFFMPYIFGNLRVEILYFALLLPFGLLKLKKITTEYYSFFMYGLLLASLSLTFIFFRDFKSFSSALGWAVNMNFILLSFIIFNLYKAWLVENLHKLLVSLFIISIGVNLIAIFQYIDPHNDLHHIIFNLYGGTPNSQFKALGMGSFAEGLVVLAHRSPGIFNGIHVIAMFNIMVIGLAFYMLLQEKSKKTFLYIIILLAVLGGMSAVSKTFIFGLLLMLLVLIRYRVLDIKIIFLLLGVVGSIFILLDSVFTDQSIILNILFNKADIGKVLSTRFSGEGYLAESVNYLLSTPDAFILGEGISSEHIALADSQIIVLFGIGGLVLFLSFVILLLKVYFLLKINLTSNYNKIIIAILISYIFIGIGIPSFNVGRIISIFFIFVFIGIEKARLEKKEITCI